MTRDIFGNVARVRNLAVHYHLLADQRRDGPKKWMWLNVARRLMDWQDISGAYRNPELLRCCPKEAK